MRAFWAAFDHGDFEAMFAVAVSEGAPNVADLVVEMAVNAEGK